MRITPSMREWLNKLDAGKNPFDYVHGRAAHGGAARITHALFRRGLVDAEGQITGEGRNLVKTKALGAK